MSAERAEWATAFETIGIPFNNLMSMSESEFREKCEFCRECGLMPSEADSDLNAAILASLNDAKEKPPPVVKKPAKPEPKPIIKKPTTGQHSSHTKNPEPAPKPSKQIPGRTNSGSVRDLQDMEYQQLQKEEQMKQERRKKEEPKAKEPVKKRVPQKAKLIAESQKIFEAPDGVAIAFVMPSGQRLSYKFEKNAKGSVLYTFIAGQEEMFKGETPRGFEIMQTIGGALQKNKTLADQGITRRTMLSVVLDDEE